MKTFKIAQLFAVAALCIAGSLFAEKCCKPQACERTCASCPAVKIPGEEVEYQKVVKESCGNAGSVKYFVTKEYVPCSMEEKEHVQTLKGCPKYLGTFDEETGEPLDDVAARHYEKKSAKTLAAVPAESKAKKTEAPAKKAPKRATKKATAQTNNAAKAVNDTILAK